MIEKFILYTETGVQKSLIEADLFFFFFLILLSSGSEKVKYMTLSLPKIF